MTALIRSASLTGFADLARSLQLDPQALLTEADLPANTLDDPDLRVPAEAVCAVLERAARLGGEPAFGVRLAETRRVSNLGPLALLVQEEPTLRRALAALAQFGRFHNEALFLRVEDAGDNVILREDLIAGQGAPVRQGTELAVAVLFRLLGRLLGPDWRPRQICFAHDAPRDHAVHLRVFGPGVLRFGQEFNGIVCRAADLDIPNPGADPVLGRYARQLMGEAMASSQPTLLQSARPLVMALLPSGRCSADLVAQHLGVDRRTVHRHLQREGQSFNAVVDALRLELAVRYLADARSLTNVSALLGFSAMSAFTRWFTSRFGMPPSAYREQYAASR